jgi:hypothetical protein
MYRQHGAYQGSHAYAEKRVKRRRWIRHRFTRGITAGLLMLARRGRWKSPNVLQGAGALCATRRSRRCGKNDRLADAIVAVNI